MRLALSLIAAAALLSSLAAEAGIIRGILLTSPPPQGSAPGPPGTQPGVRDAVIYLDEVPDKVENKLARQFAKSRKKKGPERIVQSRLRFVPRVHATPAGTEVAFENLDRVYHNVFSVSAAKRFDLGHLAPGRSDTVAFERAGVANLHCEIHPDETGFVVVTPNHAFTRPDSLGRFTLPKLPKGRYVVHVWHPRLGELRRETEMPARGDLTLDLRF